MNTNELTNIGDAAHREQASEFSEGTIVELTIRKKPIQHLTEKNRLKNTTQKKLKKDILKNEKTEITILQEKSRLKKTPTGEKRHA